MTVYSRYAQEAALAALGGEDGVPGFCAHPPGGCAYGV
jgi:hypothetical protein